MRLDQDLSEWLAPLLHKLEPAERAKLMRSISRFARERNQKRIRSQIEPDGNRFTPRKPSLRRTGNIKRGAMFTKLRLNKFLMQTSTASNAEVFWAGRTGRIAQMHHFGKQETINGKKYDYPSRHLLGLNNIDEDDMMDMILQHLGN